LKMATRPRHRQEGELKPIIVTGAPRSGTTWVGRMLALSPALYYIHEPFNPDHGVSKDICGARFNRYFTYITEKNEKPYYVHIKRMLEGKHSLLYGLASARSVRDVRKVLHRSKEFAGYRRQSAVPLIKDPIAFMSAEWIARRFDVHMVVMIRHPAAFVASMKRFNWPFRPSRWALSQKTLMKDYLYPFEEQLQELEKGDHDIIAQSILMWKVIHSIILIYQQKHKDWIFLRHEDISLDPVQHFRQLYAGFGLDFTDSIEKRIRDHSQDTNPNQASGKQMTIRLNSKANILSWQQRLSTSELSRIKLEVEDIAKLFYSDNEWSQLG
jgi:hypothetical protein